MTTPADALAAWFEHSHPAGIDAREDAERVLRALADAGYVVVPQAEHARMELAVSELQAADKLLAMISPDDAATMKLTRFASADPGHFVKRLEDEQTDTGMEQLYIWQARAILTALADMLNPLSDAYRLRLEDFQEPPAADRTPLVAPSGPSPEGLRGGGEDSKRERNAQRFREGLVAMLDAQTAIRGPRDAEPDDLSDHPDHPDNRIAHPDRLEPCPDCGNDPDDDSLHRVGCRRTGFANDDPRLELQFGPPWKPWREADDPNQPESETKQ